MKLKDLTVDIIKECLYIDAPDDVRLNMHLQSAINYILTSHGYNSIDDATDDSLTDLALIIVQDLYDNGNITTQDAIKFLSIDRRF